MSVNCLALRACGSQPNPDRGQMMEEQFQGQIAGLEDCWRQRAWLWQERFGCTSSEQNPKALQHGAGKVSPSQREHLMAEFFTPVPSWQVTRYSRFLQVFLAA